MASVRSRTASLRLWAVFAVGCILGGGGTALALAVLGGLLSPVPTTWRVGALVGLAAWLTLRDVARPAPGLPQRRTLIPRQVFGRGMARGALRFGVEYGCGFRTLVPSAAGYIAAVAVLLLGPSLPGAIALGAAFGASRSVPVLQSIILGQPGWQAFLSRHSRLLERTGSVLTAALMILAGVLLA